MLTLNKECVTSYWSQESEGGRRKYYSITETGSTVLADKTKELETNQ
ncbi:helix-turn-helix transcriptional regulator [Bacillus sp. THAF10]